MTNHINAAHAILDDATEPLCLDQIAGKIHCAKPTKAQIKSIERELRELHKATLLESTPGRGGVPYYRLTTPAAPIAPQPKPSAAAVAVHAALEGDTDPAPDLAEQLRQAHAERLAMSQTIIAICCAIGRDPGQTTTTELQQAVKDAITEARNGAAHEMAVALGKIRKAIGDDTDEIDLHALDLRIGHDYAMAKRDMQEHRDLREALVPITDELFEYYPWYELPWAVRIMGQLIDAQHAHLHAQALQIDSLNDELNAASDAALRQEQQITELRARVAAQIQAGIASANSANRLLTEVHEVLANGWPAGVDAPQGRTTLQLAHQLAADFAKLHHRQPQEDATPADAYLVTRHLRAGRGKTVADSDGSTRHKSIDTATRKARAAIRGGYVRAEIHATKLVAVATFGAEIKPV